MPAMEGLPVRYREMLVTPSSDPYTVVRTIDGSTTIGKFKFIFILVFNFYKALDEHKK